MRIYTIDECAAAYIEFVGDFCKRGSNYNPARLEAVAAIVLKEVGAAHLVMALQEVANCLHHATKRSDDACRQLEQIGRKGMWASREYRVLGSDGQGG